MHDDQRTGGKMGDRTSDLRAEAASRPLLLRSLTILAGITDGLRGDIAAVWNEPPQILVALAEWDDVLRLQGRDLEAMSPKPNRRTRMMGVLRRTSRDVARDLARAFAATIGPARLILMGDRLVTAQSKAFGVAGHPAIRKLIDRHRTQTSESLGVLRAATDAAG